jgi:hypothetical protein
VAAPTRDSHGFINCVRCPHTPLIRLRRPAHPGAPPRPCFVPIASPFARVLTRGGTDSDRPKLADGARERFQLTACDGSYLRRRAVPHVSPAVHWLLGPRCAKCICREDGLLLRYARTKRTVCCVTCGDWIPAVFNSWRCRYKIPGSPLRGQHLWIVPISAASRTDCAG